MPQSLIERLLGAHLKRGNLGMSRSEANKKRSRGLQELRMGAPSGAE